MALALAPLPIELSLTCRASFKPGVVDTNRLIEETGVGVVGANSYVSYDYARAYFVGRRMNSAAWNSAPRALQEAALKQASAILDQDYTWSGKTKVNPRQGLFWPFTDAVDRYFNPVAGVPKAVKDATCEVAFQLIQGVDPYQSQPGAGTGLKELKVDVITLVFDKAAQVNMETPAIKRMLYGYGFMAAGSIRNIKMIRG